MKNKGFTLIELLGVVIILAIIFVLIFPVASNIVSQSKETVYEKQIHDILTAAYNLTLKNINYLPESNNTYFVTLGELKYEGLIDINIKNPETNDFFSDDLVISISNVGNNYKYSNKKTKLEGGYLYKIEEKVNNKELLPKIKLVGLKQNTDGNYIIPLDLNKTLDDIEIIATSHDNIDITDKVKKYILIGEKAVDTIDTSKSNIYKIKYSVVDAQGYSNMTTLNVIIADSIPPILNNIENITIDKYTTTYDLLNGVSCEDNSGYCDIDFSGEIDYGVTGKYIIEYIVKDPSGNTATYKRLITIE